MYFLSDSSWVLAGIALIAAGAPLFFRMVPPNRWYGLRLNKTLSDRQTWYEANRVAGRNLILAGSAIVMTTLITIAFDETVSDFELSLVKLIVGALSLGIAVGHSFWSLNQL